MRCLHAYINEAETTLRMQNQMLVKNVYRKFGLAIGRMPSDALMLLASSRALPHPRMRPKPTPNGASNKKEERHVSTSNRANIEQGSDQGPV
jgi:hypothetical protein